MLCSNLAPLLLLVLAAHRTENIVTEGGNKKDYYATQLKIIGEVVKGLDMFKIPYFRYPMRKMFMDVLPMTFMGFMESYSVSKSIAAAKGINLGEDMLCQCFK